MCCRGTIRKEIAYVAYICSWFGTRDRGNRRPAYAFRYVQQGRASDFAKAVPKLPSSWRSSSHVIPQLQRDTAMGLGDQVCRTNEQDAALVCGSVGRPFLERAKVNSYRARYVGGVGRERRAGGRR